MMAPVLIATLVIAGIGAIVMGFFTGGAVFLTGAAICWSIADLAIEIGEN